MSAKKNSLLHRNVLIEDHDAIDDLLSPRNVNIKALQDYAFEAADFTTEHAMPLIYAVNSKGLPDVAMFDFTSMFSAHNASRYVERQGTPLLLAIVGDSLHEPFWPMGTGCPRGFLSVFDTAWMLKHYAAGRQSPLDVLAERESLYRLLAQSTPENLHKNTSKYTIDPKSRYLANFGSERPPLVPKQLLSLYDSDDPASGQLALARSVTGSGRHILARDSPSATLKGTLKRARSSMTETRFREQAHLISWVQAAVQPRRLRVENLTSSFRSGFVLAALISRYRPDLIDYMSIDPSDHDGNTALCLDIFEKEFGIVGPPLPWDTSQPEFQSRMFAFLTQVRDAFKDVTLAPMAPSTSLKLSAVRPAKRRLVLHELSNGVATEANAPGARAPRGQDEHPGIGESTIAKMSKGLNPGELTLRHREELLRLLQGRRKMTDDGSLSSRIGIHSSYITNKSTCIEKLPPKRIAQVENLITTLLNPRVEEIREKKPKILSKKFDSKSLQEMEDKLKTSGMGAIYEKAMSSRDQKMIAARTAMVKDKAKEGLFEGKKKHDAYDERLKEIDRRIAESQKVGAINVGTLASLHSDNIGYKFGKPGSPLLTNGNSPSPTGHSPGPNSPANGAKSPPPPVPPTKPPLLIKTPSKPFPLPQERGNPTCHFCGARTYLAERIEMNNQFMHSACFRCEYCNIPLRVGNYGFDRNEALGCAAFYCKTHLNLSLSEKLAKRRKGKLPHSGSLDAVPDLSGRPPPPTPPKPARPVSAYSSWTDEPPPPPNFPPPLPICRPRALPNDIQEIPVIHGIVGDHTDADEENHNNGVDLSDDDNIPLADQDILLDEDAEMEEDVMNMLNMTQSIPLKIDVDQDEEGNEVLSIKSFRGSSPGDIGTSDDARSRDESRESLTRESDTTETSSDDDDDDDDADFVSEEELDEIHSYLDRGDLLGPDKAEELATKWKSRKSQSFARLQQKSVDEMDSDSSSSSEDQNRVMFRHTPPKYSPNRARIRRAHSVAGDSATGVTVLASNSSLKQSPAITPLDILKLRESAKAKASLKTDAELGISPSPIISEQRLRSSSLTMSKEAIGPRQSCPPEATENNQGGFCVQESEPCRPTYYYSTGRDSPHYFATDGHSPSAGTGLVASLFGMNIDRSDRKGFSESAKEGQLLVKAGKKYNRRSRPSLSPEKKVSPVVTPSNGAVAPKANVDEVSLGSQEESPDCLAKAALSVGSGSQAASPGDVSVSSRDLRRVDRAVERVLREQSDALLRKASTIQLQIQSLERERKDIEAKGAEVERRLAQDPADKTLLCEWQQTVRDRDLLDIREQELNLLAKEGKLTREHSELHGELRRRVARKKPRTRADSEQEQLLLDKMLSDVCEKDQAVTQLISVRNRLVAMKSKNYRDLPFEQPIFNPASDAPCRIISYGSIKPSASDGPRLTDLSRSSRFEEESEV